MILTRDFDGRYVQMAPGDKAKCMFYADDRVFGWVYSGAVKMTIDGQEPKVLPKGWAFNVAPRLSYCMETVGTEPVIYYRDDARRAGAVVSGKRNADAHSGLQIHQDQDHLDRRLRLIQHAVLQCDGIWRFDAHG